MYRAEWRFKNEGEPRQKFDEETFEQAQALLEMVLANEPEQLEDFGVAAGYVAFEQKPFAYTVNNIEVSIFKIGE